MRQIALAATLLMTFSISCPNIPILPGFIIDRFSSFIVLIAGITMAFYVLGKGRLRRLNLFHILTGLFCLWGLLSFFWSVNSGLTLYRFLVNLEMIIIVWVLWEMAGNRSDQLSIMQAYVYGSYISLFSVVAMFAFNEWYPGNPGRFSALGWDPNDIGVVLSLGIPIAWYLSFHRGNKIVKWLNRIYVPAAVLAIFLTSSRTAFLAGGISLLFVLWTLRKFRLKTRFMIFVLFAVGLYVSWSMLPLITRSHLLLGYKEIVSMDISGRVDIWRAGVRVFAQHPFLGAGSGTFRSAVEPILGVAKAPHNAFISVLAEQGFVGIVLFVALLLFVLKLAARGPAFERHLWTVLLLVWLVGASTLGWDYRQPTWFLFGLLVSIQAPRVRSQHSAIRFNVEAANLDN